MLPFSMRHCPILALALALSGCSDSPTSPSPTPQPAPPPAPVFLNMVAGWSGRATLAAVIRQTNERGTNVCDQSWVVTSQTGGTFTGTFQSSGGTLVACAQAGTFTGVITTSGTLQSLDFDVALGAASGCTRISGSATLTGVVSATGALTAQGADALRCTVNGVALEADRTISLEMAKR